MKIKNGFTLIELLVVISIIAILMSILMPSLTRARELAKNTVCQSKLKQWGLVIEMFTNDNDGRFPKSVYNGVSAVNGHWWMQSFRPYYNDPDLRLCTNTLQQPAGYTGQALLNRRDNEAWASLNPFPEHEQGVMIEGQSTILGSYGPNGWLIDTSEGTFGRDVAESHWGRKERVTQPNNVPAFLDSFWVDAWPMHNDYPQDPYDRRSWSTLNGEMQKFLVDRHSGRINGVFVDGAVQRISLKRLWGYKWHRNFDTSTVFTTEYAPFPDWLKRMPD